MSPQDPDQPTTPQPDDETGSINSSAFLPGSDIRQIPESIGPYKILDVLGEGGMGVVYLAEQREPIRRRVALKCMKRTDHKEFLARFEAERQALAMMNHPNIARVHDAGATEDGRPYFAMEHIEGVPITEYCDGRKLSIAERLKLFVQVCQGVEHAHHRGIIHRDIKPSNILVAMPDREPVAKIIDFGVAKAVSQRLTERTLYTEVGRVIGTPEYMSPEQAQTTGGNVDHRTDIYSLGVLLYELIVGELPLELDPRSLALEEVLRRIREEEPLTPSTLLTRLNVERTRKVTAKRQTTLTRLSNELRGDLDWISMKAMEKERERRYERASNLADDVTRRLKSEAVLARSPSALYRLRKFTRKNRGPVAALTAIFLSLVTGLVIALFFYAIAEKRRAENSALADYGLLRTYTEKAGSLWPYPFEKRVEPERWVEKAEALLDRLDDHRDELERLRRKALPEEKEDGPGASGETQQRIYRFSDGDAEQRHEMLEMLVGGLEMFGDPDPTKGTVAQVTRRLAIFPSRELFEKRWGEAIAAIATSPKYSGVSIKRIADLFPTGEDPRSGLWEFVHLRTGGAPERGKDGKHILTGETGLVLVLLPGGKFLMGAQRGDESKPNYDRDAEHREGPVHEVTLSPFFIAKYEVHQAVWERVMGKNPAHFKGNSLPVEQVTWINCRGFCKKLGLALPSEAQWEYACRGGTSTPYGGTGQLEDMGWYDGNSAEKTHPVGQKRPNAFGLHNMHGNVCEWCEDMYNGSFYSKPEATRPDPVVTSVAAGLASSGRVLRGGSWFIEPGACRSAYRSKSHQTYRDVIIGVRPAFPLP